MASANRSPKKNNTGKTRARATASSKNSPSETRAAAPRARKATARAAAAPAQPIDHGQVAERAYRLWQARGCVSGQDEQIWFEAESQLREQLAGATGG